MNLRTLVLGLAVVATAGLNSYVAQADSQLDSLIKNPSNWAAQAGDYSVSPQSFRSRFAMVVLQSSKSSG